MARLASETHRAGQVVGSHDDARQAGHGQDLVEVPDGVDVLDLHDDDHVFVGLAAEIGAACPTVAGGPSRAEPADSLGRIETAGHGTANVVRGADQRHDHAGCPDVEDRLDQDRVVPRHPDDRRRVGPLGCHDVPLHRLDRQRTASVMVGSEKLIPVPRQTRPCSSFSLNFLALSIGAPFPSQAFRPSSRSG